MNILIGDIGGTHTRLCLFDIPPDSQNVKIGINDILKEITYKSQDHNSFITIIHLFLAEIKIEIDRAVIAIAGPVNNGTCKLTNLIWSVSEEEIRNATNIKIIRLINDLEAHSYYIPHLGSEEFVTIHQGKKQEKKNICVLAPGTGLGEAFLTWSGNNYVAHPTEGGHSNFSPENQIQIELLDFLTKKLNSRVSVERVCSSIGIQNIFNFLRLKKGFPVPDIIQKLLSEDWDPVPTILDLALNHRGKSELCDQTTEIFFKILGSECGNFALKILPKSGLYLTGGIPQNNVHGFVHMYNEHFLGSFLNKGRMKTILEDIPIYLVLQKKTGIFGAAHFSLSL